MAAYQTCGAGRIPSSQIGDHLLPSSMYLTFNRPEKDEFHRAILVTTAQPKQGSGTQEVGTLIHAVYKDGAWHAEIKPVKNIGNSKNIVLLWKISPVAPCAMPKIADVVNGVPFNVERGNPESEASRRLDVHIEKGLPLLGGYSCILWTEEVLRALKRNGIIQTEKDVGEIMAQARAEAGPEDATLAVNMDFKGTRVVNDDS